MTIPSPSPAPGSNAPLAASLPVEPTLGIEVEQTFLQFVIGRYDGFFDSVHNKANFWLAFNTFALGGIIAGYKDFVTPLCAGPGQWWLDFEMMLFIALNLTSTIFILAASMPYLKRKDSPVLNSDWHANLNKLTPEDVLRDHREQAHELAIGLARKYRRLHRGGWLLMGQVAILGVLFATYILTPPCPKPAGAPAPSASARPLAPAAAPASGHRIAPGTSCGQPK
jgi:hypothetical protein